MHLVKTSTLSRSLPVVRDSNPRLGQFGLNAGTAPKWIPHRCCRLASGCSARARKWAPTTLHNALVVICMHYAGRLWAHDRFLRLPLSLPACGGESRREGFPKSVLHQSLDWRLIGVAFGGRIQEDRRKMPAERPRQENLARFIQLVLADGELHARLCAPADPGGFAALAVRLGRDKGCDFTAEEVWNTVRERRRAWLERGL